MALGRQRTVRFDEERGMPPLPVQQNRAAFPAIKLGAASSGDIPIQQKQAAFPAIKPAAAGSENTKFFDPSSDFMLMWDRIFLFSCLLALFIDPLYFYVPKIDYGTPYSCVGTDRHLTVIVTFLRSITDLFYVIRIIMKFRTAFFKKSSTLRIFKGGYFVTDPGEIAWKYLRSDFAIDVLAALPLPQIIVWYMIPAIKSIAEHDNNILVLAVLAQYLPRLYLIFPLTYEIIKATEVAAKTAWQGAVCNLLLYMIASHVLGAVWYLLSVDRQTACWQMSCRNEAGCDIKYLDCDMALNQKWSSTTDVFHSCNASDTSITFDYGMFLPALSNLVPSQGFLIKFFYSLWWGLQNLSCYGQTLSVSTYVGETLFCIFLAVFALFLESSGLVLFANLIGNVQTSLQSVTARDDEWRLKQRDTEEWMRRRQLPDDLRERIRRFIQFKWHATRGVNGESILQVLPEDLRRDIKRHLCLGLVRRVPFFSQMDDQFLDVICVRLAPSLCSKGSYIFREGDPVTEMLFIIRGEVESSTTDSRTGLFDSVTLKPGDFYGEELLGWAPAMKPTPSLPLSTRTVKALMGVEAFSLQAEDLKFVASEFMRLHSKKLHYSFRYYSDHWRTWGACFIQAASRRCRRRKMAKELMRDSFASMRSGDSDPSGLHRRRISSV